MTDDVVLAPVDAAPPTWQRLPARARTLFYLQAFSRLIFFWVPTTLIAAGFLAGFWAVLPAFGLAAVFLLLRFVVALWMPALSWSRWAWMLREHDLLVTSGVFFRSVTAIPLTRIQHVDSRQGPFEQWLGLARLQIYTASGSGADGFIPGLDAATAEALRDRLVREQGDDGV